jgi:NDP-sugar pyrophosphorylase family protein
MMMHEPLESKARRLAAGSELLRAVASVREDGGLRFALGDASLRRLHRPEIDLLESLGSTARDWSRVRVADGFNPRRVRNCEFHGDVALGRFTRYVELADGVEVVAGLSGCTVADCVVGHNALVRDVRLLAHYVVGEGAVLADCGRVTCSAGTTFGNGARVPVALEGGGREVEVFAEIDVELAAVAASPGWRRAELDGFRRAVAEYRDRAACGRGVIGAGARVWGVPRLEDTFVGPAACVDGATAVVRSTLLSTADEPVVVGSGAVVRDSLLQWGSRVTGLAVVESSVLVESARVERHGKVQNSVIGPNTEVAAGEVSSCVLGPFVGCHHQSLLISTLWPGGRGNVGYGANVGSNHTSRAPDQEFWAGEGLFLGLGVNVKFPCDFSRAPYTVIACATNLPPQKVTFPFSLIALPQERFPGVAPTYNRISPGWVLRENAYSLRRCEAKFRARDRAKRSRSDLAVLRQETVECVLDACRRLAGVGVVKDLYTDRDIPGLGKNVMTEQDRVKAIETYEFYARYWALLGLKVQARAAVLRGADAGQLLLIPSADPTWEYQRQLLVGEDRLTDPAAALDLLAEMAGRVARDVERARQRDDARGGRIITDYADIHPPAAEDPIVRAAQDEARAIQEDVRSLLRHFSPARRPAQVGGGTPDVVRERAAV